ncbi:MAG: heparan-alpha-glucosaminide N-acetyltransferase domain-containing protein [Bacillota bacterium]|nr:heparan-alpha-glucosaminide N-acetyltransferase domain-containing protein [Bacillota bacterium]
MVEAVDKKDRDRRSGLIDSLRGVLVISMILYHGMYDLVYLFGMEAPWFHGTAGFLWQQITCCIFILLSGFCSALGKQTAKRGVVVLLWGTLVSLVTLIVMPEQRVLFGVLMLIGSCMILVGAAKALWERIPAAAGMIAFGLLFLLSRRINEGVIGIGSRTLFEVPAGLYRNNLTAYLGFPHEAFFSTDYFSIIPWLFLFLSGFFLFRLWGRKLLSCQWKGILPLNWIGRHALILYVLHQPLLYGVLQLFY